MANTITKFWTKYVYSIRPVTSKKAFANLFLLKKGIRVKFQIDSGSTRSILPLNVYKDISGDNDLKDLNTEFKPVLSLYDEETKNTDTGNQKSLHLILLPRKK